MIKPSQNLDDFKAYKKTNKMMELFREAVREAQEESRRLGVPNVYFINGRTYYELPNGELTLEDPWKDDDSAEAQSGE